MDFILTYQWEVFITLEILSVISLLLFGVVRYVLHKRKVSVLFIFLFLLFLIFEASLAMLLYKETGEIATFQIVIFLFVIYACTFGIVDFKKLDRWMREKVGNWRGEELLTEKDYKIIEKSKDSKHVARKYRFTSTIHLVVFVIVQSILWVNGTANMAELIGYLKDFSWIEAGTYENSPYASESLYAIGMIWGVVFIVDFIYSWSYTIFSSKK